MATTLAAARIAPGRSRIATAGVWTLQILLALAFLAHGLMFLFPPAEVAVQMNATLPRWFSLFLGVAEVLASIGLILPAATGVQPWLTVWAAGGVMIVTGSATILHLVRNEISAAVTTIVLFSMAAAVVRLRTRPRSDA